MTFADERAAGPATGPRGRDCEGAAADLAAHVSDDETAFESRVRALVVAHVGVLLEEDLLVVTSSAGPSVPDDVDLRVVPRPTTDPLHLGPTVLAIDRSGRRVVVEVARVLDDAALVRCLSVAGRAADAAVEDLARRFPQGPARFRSDLAAFLTTGPGEPALPADAETRLVVVCGEVAPQTRDALRFLRGSGPAVEVVPLTWQTVDRVVRTVSESVQAPPEEAAPEQAVEAAPPPAPVVAVPQGPPVAAAPAAPVPPASPSPQAPPTSVAPPTPAAPAEAAPAPAPPRRAAHAPAPLPALRPHRTASRSEPLTITTELPLRPAAPALPRTRLPRPAADARPSRPLAQKSAALQAAVTGIPVAAVPEEAEVTIFRDLRVLCAEISAPVPLVWVRERRGERHEALLHPNGVIEVADGARYRNPSTAAAAVSGSFSQVDGWNAWRVGENGPTLAEAWNELYG